MPLPQDKNNLIEERDLLKCQRDSLEEQKTQWLTERETLIQERDLLQCQRDSLEEQKTQWLTERETLIQERDLLQCQRDNLEEQKTQLMAEKDTLLHERDLLQCQRDSLEEQKTQLMAEKDTLLQERDLLSAQQDRLEAQKTQLMAEKTELLQEKENIFNQLSYLNITIPEILDIKTLKNKARQFQINLDAKKQALNPSEFSWYPYNTLNNFAILEQLLTGKNRFLLELIGEKTALDIGCADGDLAFFLESLSCKVEVIDFPPTNFNGLRGIKLLKDSLLSSVEIREIDLDTQFILPQKNYGLVFFLGILYHLKNPFYILESLAKATDYCLISTRIAKFNAVNSDTKNRTDISSMPVAYLVDEFETNNDSTNYWIFSDIGLRRILKRTGWEICDYITVGNTEESDPASPEGDERAFCLVKSQLS